MFFDFFRLDLLGDSPSPFELASRLLFTLLFALLLAVAGSRLKRHLGAAFALVFGAIVLFFNRGVLGF
jgi:hypothetical protein